MTVVRAGQGRGSVRVRSRVVPSEDAGVSTLARSGLTQVQDQAPTYATPFDEFVRPHHLVHGQHLAQDRTDLLLLDVTGERIQVGR